MKTLINTKSFTETSLLNEITESIDEAEAIIAGTELYTPEYLNDFKKLKVISRMGAGYDNIPLNYLKQRNIALLYTPDAPADSVAEFTIAQMISLIRQTHTQYNWNRAIGRQISELTIGILGLGHIGSRVLKHLSSFNPRRILINDIDPTDPTDPTSTQFVNAEELFYTSSVVTIHIPLQDIQSDNHGFITPTMLASLAERSTRYWPKCLINTSRGGLLDEEYLLTLLNRYPSFRVALDTFKNEPYQHGPLREFANQHPDQLILSSHMGSKTYKAFHDMQYQAVENIKNFQHGTLDPERRII